MRQRKEKTISSISTTSVTVITKLKAFWRARVYVSEELKENETIFGKSSDIKERKSSPASLFFLISILNSLLFSEGLLCVGGVESEKKKANVSNTRGLPDGKINLTNKGWYSNTFFIFEKMSSACFRPSVSFSLSNPLSLGPTTTSLMPLHCSVFSFSFRRFSSCSHRSNTHFEIWRPTTTLEKSQVFQGKNPNSKHHFPLVGCFATF